jgi:TPR repeat protein
VLLIVWGCASVPDIGPVAAAGDPDAGVLTIKDGARAFRIRFDALTYTGRGRFVWPDGRSYEGDFVAGRLQGHGIDVRADGSHYEGEFDRGGRHGNGHLTLPDGSVYEGNFANGARSGHGTYTSVSGRYEGDWARDAPNGFGRFDYADGSWYEGEWEMGRRNGFGRYQRDMDSGYEGDWRHDLPHGFGRLTEHTGFSYEGGFNDGERAGYGVIDVGDGIGYAGTWVDNQRQGYGRETRPDGSTYEGDWHGDRRNGNGIDRHADGSFHQGVWEDNSPLGPGTRRSAEGVEISGLWNGSFVSSGIVTLPGGAQYAGNIYELSKRAVAVRFQRWLAAQARSGDPYAHLLLAEAFMRFRRPAPDPAMAQKHYRAAAAAGIAEAQFQLAEALFANPKTVPVALDWLQRAAVQGHAGANVRLGTLYQIGRYVAKDHGRAVAYFEAATAGGDLGARNNLAWLLATSPKAALRDGARAVVLSRPMAVLYDQWTYLDTLAAAYAETGDFRNAVRTAQRAVALAEGDAPSETLLALEARLRAFERHEAFREI